MHIQFHHCGVSHGNIYFCLPNFSSLWLWTCLLKAYIVAVTVQVLWLALFECPPPHCVKSSSCYRHSGTCCCAPSSATPFLINQDLCTAWSLDNPQPGGPLPPPQLNHGRVSPLSAHRKKAVQQWQLLLVIPTYPLFQLKVLTSHIQGFGFCLSRVHRF